MAISSAAFARTLGSSAAAADLLAHDWAKSALGPIATWPRWLTSTLATVMRSPAPMALMCGKAGLMLYNEGYRIIAGAGHPGLLGCPVRAAWPDAAQFNGAVLDQVLAGQSLSYRDQRFLLARGGQTDERWFDLDYSPVFDDAGNPAAALAVVREQHRAANALRESQRRLDQAQAAGGVGTFTLELATGTLVATSGFNRIFGLPDAPCIDSARVDALVIPDADGLRSHAFDRAGQGTALQAEYRIARHDDGAQRWILRRADVERDAAGVAERMVGVVQDITERKTAELALAGSAARFQTVTEALPNLVWTAQPDGRLDWLNARACEYSALAPDALPEQGWMAVVHADDALEAGRLWRNCVASGAYYDTEYRIRRADGQYRWHLVRAVPQRGPDGCITRWIGSSTDIHERIRLDTHNVRTLHRI